MPRRAVGTYILRPLASYEPHMLELTSGSLERVRRLESLDMWLVDCTDAQAKELEQWWKVTPDFPLEMVV